ncbi:MAG: MFS transporter [Actinobacteria bacterium]|nr:MFS transporter [Actinomycetota bacterium]
MKREIIFFSILNLIIGLTGIVIRPLIPIVSKDINIGLDMIGIVLSAISFGFFISVILTGYLSDRYGTKLTIALGLLISIISSLGFGLTYTFFILLISGLLMGIGRGTLMAGINAHVVNIYPEKRGANLLKLSSFFCLGTAIGTFIVSIILFLKLNWRFSFIIFFFIYIFITLYFLRKKATEHKISLQEEKNTNSLQDEQIKDFNKEDIKNIENHGITSIKNQLEKIHLKEYLNLFKNPIIIFSGILLIFFGGTVVAFSTWYTTYFSSFGIKVAISSLGLSLYWLSLMAGVKLKQIAMNFLEEYQIILLGCLLNAIFMIIITFSGNIVIKVIASIMIGLFLGGFTPLTTSLAISQKPELSGFISGYILGMLSLGNMIFQPFIGYFSERFGEGSGIYIQLTGSLLLFITTVILAIFYKRKKLSGEIA